MSVITSAPSGSGFVYVFLNTDTMSLCLPNALDARVLRRPIGQAVSAVRENWRVGVGSKPGTEGQGCGACPTRQGNALPSPVARAQVSVLTR